MKDFEFELNKITVPYYRLGFFGLSLFKDYDFSERKFNIEVDEDNNLIKVHIEDDGEKDFNDFVDGIWGDFKNGYAVPFGYVDNELDVGIYSTACAHKGFTQLFIPPSARQTVKRCIATEQDIYVGCLDEGTEEAPKPFKIKLRSYSGEEEQLVGEKAKKRVKIELFTQNRILANTHHPAFGLNNNIQCELFANQEFLLAFSSLAYAFIGYGKFVLAIGMDAKTITEFYEYFDEFTKYRFETKNKRGMAQISGIDWPVAAGLLAHDLRLKNDQIYNVIYKDDNGVFINWLEYSEQTENIFSVIWDSGSVKIAENDKASIYKLKGLVLRGTPQEPLLSAYTQIYKNISLNMPWYSEFYWLASMDSRYINKRVLTEVFNKLGDDMEKEIRDRFKSIVGGIAHSKQGVGDPYKYALEFAVKQNLRTVVDKATLMNALAKIFCQANFGFTTEQMKYLDSLNPCFVRDLLITSAYTLKDKAEEANVEEDKE